MNQKTLNIIFMVVFVFLLSVVGILLFKTDKTKNNENDNLSNSENVIQDNNNDQVILDTKDQQSNEEESNIENNLKTYQNIKYSYSVKYPSNWYVDATYSEKDFTLRGPVEDNNFIGGDTTWSNYKNPSQYNPGNMPSDLQSVNLLIYKTDSNIILNDFVKIKHFAYSDLSNITINGISGFVLKGNSESQGLTGVLLKVEDKVFYFNSKSEVLMNQMIKTFEVK
ncbi:MAG: hypothetical protein PHZ07_01035 [Patescibacteria group bacterium]|nr:hypothetical protein [Patescibacteria group bacterium]MDD4303977.1 hypothetical protein [Patescibacteria group bacterium]MDD4695034.1 hypothetical protein [Patescibacteria group bacterium]